MKSLLKLSLLTVMLIFLNACQKQNSQIEVVKEYKEYTTYLVRHAEKADKSKDPVLSPEGIQRAMTLNHVLSNVSLDHIHSSDYIRTRETAAPVALAKGLDTELYNPKALNEIAAKLDSLGGTHLIVGHSNSTPNLVELLGGERESPIDDGGEYDRLYIIHRHKDGSVSSTLMRYGSPYLVADK